MDSFSSTQFFDEFIKTITIAKKPNARLEVEYRGKIIGILCKDGIVWQNKWMHWPGCCNGNSSYVRLLNLAKKKHPLEINGQQHTEEVENDFDQLNLLDSIFDYLDVIGLH